MTSETSFGETLALSRAAPIATQPNSCAGTLAKDPLNEPTGVLAPEAITTSIKTSSHEPATIGKRKNAALQNSVWTRGIRSSCNGHDCDFLRSTALRAGGNWPGALRWKLS